MQRENTYKREIVISTKTRRRPDTAKAETGTNASREALEKGAAERPLAFSAQFKADAPARWEQRVPDT